MPRRTLLLALFLVAAAPALAEDFVPCDDLHVGLTNVAAPVADNAVTVYDGLVTLYNIDMLEPACCSAGIAIVLPDPDDPLGGAQCRAIVGFTTVDVAAARRDYDPARGLRLDVPVRLMDEEGNMEPEEMLPVRIDLQAHTVTLEE
ncbi:hypothetical protein [Prosthecomicrobium pneumaticum]|uniref:DUF2195 domain-containing protein n=1 Tax=Prosthecomicrobium pneumaticum TaxID=81895 RepID=A0A7W9L2I5_9HYPH|nr:hypothetical protein [Prosthecomicrobium pneumaticum]MBB5753533.1 hypothetical protein [Prosthecomicrobium pneumaticum]